MRTNIKKVTKIVDELTSYILLKRGSNISINIMENEGKYVIKFFAENIMLSKSDVSDIKEALGTPRQKDMEEYYWQLGGLNQPEGELELIGMMTDDFSISYENNKLSLELIRG